MSSPSDPAVPLDAAPRPAVALDAAAHPEVPSDASAHHALPLEGAALTRHGSIRLVEDRCTSCMICARECPAWCIQIDSHTEQVSGQGGAPLGGAAGATPTSGYARARQRSRNVLDRFEIDWSLCMYCGICVEQCPFDALEWAGPHVATAASREAMAHQREQLR